MEEWKQINDSPNYEVSSFGNVRNKQSGKILKKMISNGRYMVDLGRKNRGQRVSRLVGKAFLQPEEGKYEIDHINRDCLDDRSCNLRWVNRSENVQNTRDRGTQTGERCIYKTPTSYLVQIMRNSRYVYRKNFPSLEEAIQNRNLFLNSYTQAPNQIPYIQDQPLAPQ